MPHPFLSEEWFAAAKQLADEYEGRLPPPPGSAKVSITVTGGPDGDVHMHIDTTSGQAVLERGELPGADASVTTDYATARSMFLEQDQQAAMQAFMSGKVKVTGDMMKLMTMQPQPNDAAKEMAGRLKEMTAP